MYSFHAYRKTEAGMCGIRALPDACQAATEHAQGQFATAAVRRAGRCVQFRDSNIAVGLANRMSFSSNPLVTRPANSFSCRPASADCRYRYRLTDADLPPLKTLRLVKRVDQRPVLRDVTVPDLAPGLHRTDDDLVSADFADLD